MRTTLVILYLILPSVGCATTTVKNWSPEWQESGASLLPVAAGRATSASSPGTAAGPPSTLRRGTMSAGGAVGFTVDPETFLMTGAGDYFLSDNLAVGPLLQLGLADDRLMFAPTANVKAVFDLPGPGFERLKPFAQGGLGLAYIQKDRRGDDDDVGFLLNFGFGADYFLTERFSLGNSVLFNITPDKVRGENFFFSWQFVSASFRF